MIEKPPEENQPEPTTADVLADLREARERDALERMERALRRWGHE